MKNSQRTFAEASDDFRDYWKKSGRKVHGGSHAIGLRKTKRPFNSKKPMHLVLRASRARGSLSMWTSCNNTYLKNTLQKHARLNQVSIYDYSNNGNHLHLAIHAKDRVLFQKFLRTITGLIARHVLKAKRGEPKGKFWDFLPFTRIAELGKSFDNLKSYVLQNILEGAGIIPYQIRRHHKRRHPVVS